MKILLPFSQEALGWKQSIRDYAAANQDRVRGTYYYLHKIITRV